MPTSRTHRNTNRHHRRDSDRGDEYDAYSSQLTGGSGGYYLSPYSDNGDEEYFRRRGTNRGSPLSSARFSQDEFQETRPRHRLDRQDDDSEMVVRQSRRGNIRRLPMDVRAEAEDDQAFDDFAHTREPLGRRGARGRYERFHHDTEEDSSEGIDRETWGPPDHDSHSVPDYHDPLYDGVETHEDRETIRQHSDDSVPTTSISPRNDPHPRYPRPRLGSGLGEDRERRSRPRHRPSPPGRNPAWRAESSDREDSSRRPLTPQRGSELGNSPALVSNDSEEDLRRAIELSRLAAEGLSRQQEREQEEQIESVLQQSKAEALEAAAEAHKKQKRLLQEQERLENEVMEASRAMAEAEGREEAEQEFAVIEQSRKEARARERELKRRELEEFERENAILEESRVEARAREREFEERQLAEVEREQAILEASRRAAEAREEEEFLKVLEQSRLLAQKERRGGGRATSPPNAARESTTRSDGLGGSDTDMEEILRQIAQQEARVARAEREFGGTDATGASADPSVPRTAAEIEADNDAALRAALSESLGDSARAADPDDGDPDPPPTYDEALASEATTE